MALTRLEQWQLLAWLLYQKASRPLEQQACVVLHQLLLALVGENYQQVMCEPPRDAIGNIALHLTPGALEVRSVESTAVLHRFLEAADDDSGILARWLLQHHIRTCTLSFADEMDRWYEAFAKSMSQLPLLTPQPLVANANSGDSSAKWQRKWKKFRRDPALFLKDFLGKRGR